MARRRRLIKHHLRLQSNPFGLRLLQIFALFELKNSSDQLIQEVIPHPVPRPGPCFNLLDATRPPKQGFRPLPAPNLAANCIVDFAIHSLKPFANLPRPSIELNRIQLTNAFRLNTIRKIGIEPIVRLHPLAKPLRLKQ